jgi:demethylmacrocin O-methyltransferase
MTHNYRFLVGILLTTSANLSAMSLDELADKFGTDKATNGPDEHGYTLIYEQYLQPLKKLNLTLLEIGLSGGGSAQMWDAYFERAELHFLEIDDRSFNKIRPLLSERCHLHQGDQSNPTDLQRLVTKIGKPLDIIIDDGGHTMEQQLTSFRELFPHVKSGGMYIIEDLHTSYWNMWGGSGTQQSPAANEGTTVYFLRKLIDDLNAIGAYSGVANRTTCPDAIKKKLSFYQTSIRSMHFYTSLCIIIKD